MSFANHAKQGLALVLTVDYPLCVKNLVTTVFAIGLREHHQFHIVRVTTQAREGIHQVFNFVLGQRQTHFLVGLLQGRHATAQNIHGLDGLAFQLGEQRLTVKLQTNNSFGHAVVQQGSQLLQLSLIQFLGTQQATLGGDDVTHATLDTTYRLQATVMSDVSRFTGPG